MSDNKIDLSSRWPTGEALRGLSVLAFVVTVVGACDPPEAEVEQSVATESAEVRALSVQRSKLEARLGKARAGVDVEAKRQKVNEAQLKVERAKLSRQRPFQAYRDDWPSEDELRPYKQALRQAQEELRRVEDELRAEVQRQAEVAQLEQDLEALQQRLQRARAPNSP